jgi:hypothetical protein
MKKIGFLLLLTGFLTLLFFNPVSMQAQEDLVNIENVIEEPVAQTQMETVDVVAVVELPPPPNEESSMIYWIIFGVLVLYEIIVRLFPTVKDITIIGRIYAILSSILPNMKKGGGRFTLS